MRLFVEVPGVRLVILDLVDDSADAEEDYRDLRTAAPEVAILVLGSDRVLRQALGLVRDGAAGYLIKPVTAQALALKVRGLLVSERTGERGAETSDGGESLALLSMTRHVGMQALLGDLCQVAATDVPVLIEGESGTGKELIARALHGSSPRSRGAFVPVNLGAVPFSLWEGELFGYVRGAFTDARRDSIGLIGYAEGGTLFLDEVGEMPPLAQVKLLRFLQDHEYRQLGGARSRVANVRIVAATNRSLGQMVSEGLFRADLFYRLAVVPLHVPPLRQRACDIPALAKRFLVDAAVRYGRPVTGFSPAAFERLSSHPWPGNVRELENVVHRAVVLARGSLIDASALSFRREPEPLLSLEASPSSKPISMSLVEERREALGQFERRYLEDALRRARGNITHAAAASGVPRKTFWRLMQRHGVVALRNGVASRPGRPLAARPSVAIDSEGLPAARRPPSTEGE